MKWYLHVLKNYANFKGRARRKEYWMFALINILMGYAMTLLDYLTVGLLGSLGVFSLIYGLAMIVPNFAVTVRRLHDVGKSGWFMLWGIVPGILVFMAAVLSFSVNGGYAFMGFFGILTLGGFIYLFVLTVTEGEEGKNEYGPDPKNPTNELDQIGLSEI